MSKRDVIYYQLEQALNAVGDSRLKFHNGLYESYYIVNVVYSKMGLSDSRIKAIHTELKSKINDFMKDNYKYQPYHIFDASNKKEISLLLHAGIIREE